MSPEHSARLLANQLTIDTHDPQRARIVAEQCLAREDPSPQLALRAMEIMISECRHIMGEI